MDRGRLSRHKVFTPAELAALQRLQAEYMEATNEQFSDAWVGRLKAAYDAGYYRTEPAVDAQTPFPWQNKTCKSCPFWATGICQVHEEYRSPLAHTCRYFDLGNRQAAQSIIDGYRWQGFHRWWEWFNGRGAPR